MQKREGKVQDTPFSRFFDKVPCSRFLLCFIGAGEQTSVLDGEPCLRDNMNRIPADLSCTIGKLNDTYVILRSSSSLELVVPA